MLEFRADEHIRSEFARVERELSMIQISPIFGAASFSIDSKLAFVLMPFGGDLDKFYENVIKPTVEAPKYGLVCKRADTVFSTQAIMLDIWKSICESRIIIADLTGHNPNVFYELGIAHTLGKDTILIYRKGRNNKKFPFDLFHIRRIEYTNDAVSGQKFINDLQATLEAVLKPPVLS